MTPERKNHESNAEQEAIAEIEAVRDEMRKKAGTTRTIGVGADGKIRSVDGRELKYDIQFLEEAAKNPHLFGSLVVKERFLKLLEVLKGDRVQRVLKGSSDKENIATKLKEQAIALRQLMNMLGDEDMKARMATLDNDGRLRLPADEKIADKNPTALDFLVRIGKRKPTLFTLAKVTPFAVRILTSPGYFTLTQKEALAKIQITETKGVVTSLDSINGLTIQPPHPGTGININLSPGTFEYDLVMMKVNEEDELFDVIWQSYVECVSGSSEKNQTETKMLPKELVELRKNITAAAVKINSYLDGETPADKIFDSSSPSKKFTPAEQEELKRLTEKEAHGNLTSDEELRLHELQARSIINRDEAKYQLETEIRALEEKKANDSRSFTTRDERILNRLKKRLEQWSSNEGSKSGVNFTAQLQAIQKRIRELDATEPKTPEVHAEIARLTADHERVSQERLQDIQYKQYFSDNSERDLRLLSESTGNQMREAIKHTHDQKEIKLVERAERFIKESHSIDAYVKNFYQPLYHEILKEVKTAHPTLSEHELGERTADRVDSEVQSIISYIVTFLVSPVLESGGEPTGHTPAQQALAQAKAVGIDNAQRLGVIQRALTRLKMNGAKLQDLPSGADEHMLFADTYRETHDVWDPINNRTKRERYGRIKKECHHGGQAFWKHARNMEEFFEVMQMEMYGNYDIRGNINAGGGDFYKEIGDPHGKLHHYGMAKQFDMVHNSEIGPEVAAAFPLAKTLMMRYFAEKGWVVDDEIEKEIYEPKGYLNQMVNQFMAKNYPHYSETKRNMITYIAVKQAYIHSVYQLMLSNSKPLAGFTGMKHKFGNFFFNERAIAHKFPASLSTVAWDEYLTHRAFDKGAAFLPCAPGGFDAIKGMDPSRISNYTDIAYGAVMYELSGKYGYFLQHFNPHFEEHLPDMMSHQNRFNVGSDDHLRGWRQQKKSKDNVSQKLFTYADRKDWCTLSSYASADHFTLLWKSVENLGTNYLRAWSEDVILGASYSSEKAKYDNLAGYFYDRYFDGCKLGMDFGKKILSTVMDGAFASVTDRSSFIHAIDSEIKKAKKGDKKKSAAEMQDDMKNEVYKSIFYAVHTILMAERTPSVFMDATTPWGEQTGITLIAQLKKQILQDPNDPLGIKDPTKADGGFDHELWKQTTDDLVFIQKEARGGSSRAILDKRAEWEEKSSKDGLNSNTFGDFASNRSSFRLDGSDEDGYVITDAYITSTLTKKYSADPAYSSGGVLNEKGKKQVERVLGLRKRILAEMLKAPELPKYEDLVKDMLGSESGKKDRMGPPKVREALKGLLPRAIEGLKSPDKAENARFLEMVKKKIGTKEEYEARYKAKLKARSVFFMEKWKNEELTFQPEADAAENFMHYENADADHIGRMARDIQDTALHVKDDLDPDKETSVNEMIKNFAKDPMGAIDKMAEYLNPYRKKIGDARGEQASIDYVGWYVNRVLQANLKEERFRNGFTGMFQDMRALLFGQNKTSYAGDKNQPFTSKSLSAYQTNRVIRYLIQKKLIGGGQGDDYMRRYRATTMDVIKEMAPRIATVAFVAGGIHLLKSSTDKDDNLK